MRLARVDVRSPKLFGPLPPGPPSNTSVRLTWPALPALPPRSGPSCLAIGGKGLPPRLRFISASLHSSMPPQHGEARTNHWPVLGLYTPRSRAPVVDSQCPGTNTSPCCPPHVATHVVPSFDLRIHHCPVDGLYTAGSCRPSPSKSPDTATSPGWPHPAGYSRAESVEVTNRSTNASIMCTSRLSRSSHCESTSPNRSA